MPSANNISRPVLRYHGGKFGNNGSTADWICSHLPKHRLYVEPFGGAASVLMRKERSPAEVYNDLDRAITALFHVLSVPYMATELERRCRMTPFSREEFEYAQSYIRAERQTGFMLRDPVEHARLILVASFMGHGSAGLRSKSSTGFRASESGRRYLASNDWKNYTDHITTFTERLQGVMIECRPWRQVAERYDKEDTLVYIDPPYLHAVRTSSASDGYLHELGPDDHAEIAEWCHRAESLIIVSHYDHPLYRKLYAGWDRKEKVVGVDSGSERTEVLWLNPRAAEMQQQQSLFTQP